MSRKLIRPLEPHEFCNVVDYFHSASDKLLAAMGAVRSKLPARDEWEKRLKIDAKRELEDRDHFYVGWEYQGKLIGHSSISDIEFGKVANIHLHMWNQENRKSGLGT